MDFDDIFRDLNESMRKAEENNERRRRDHQTMLMDPYVGPVQVGDTILVRADMVGAGCGHQWEVLELPVVQVTKTAVKVTRKAWRGEVEELWIGRELIMEVLHKEPGE